MRHVEYDPNGGCWLCDLAERKDGYVNICIDGKTILAHRASWALHNGPIPEGLDVLHRCDVRPCINPDHLFGGDDFVNQQDCVRKGRRNYALIARRGIDNHFAKLCEDDVLTIRYLAAEAAMPQAAIADLFGVAQSLICLIHTRKLWDHL